MANKGDSEFGARRTLRRRAEDRVKAEPAAEGADPGSPATEADCLRAIHELRVHQVELEMQNDELRRTYQELERSRARYRDLYDLAPVAYFTVGEDGTILDANLTAAVLLGIGRTELVSSPFARHLFPDDRDLYSLHGRSAAASGTPASCELRVLRKGDSPFWALLRSAPAKDEGGRAVLRIVLSDIGDRKKVEQERELLVSELRNALDRVMLLSGLLPICSWCRKVRDDDGYWSAIEQYVSQHSAVEFTHGICPDCLEKHFPAFPPGKD